MSGIESGGIDFPSPRPKPELENRFFDYSQSFQAPQDSPMPRFREDYESLNQQFTESRQQITEGTHNSNQELMEEIILRIVTLENLRGLNLNRDQIRNLQKFAGMTEEIDGILGPNTLTFVNSKLQEISQNGNPIKSLEDFKNKIINFQTEESTQNQSGQNTPPVFNQASNFNNPEINTLTLGNVKEKIGTNISVIREIQRIIGAKQIDGKFGNGSLEALNNFLANNQNENLDGIVNRAKEKASSSENISNQDFISIDRRNLKLSPDKQFRNIEEFEQANLAPIRILSKYTGIPSELVLATICRETNFGRDYGPKFSKSFGIAQMTSILLDDAGALEGRGRPNLYAPAFLKIGNGLTELGNCSIIINGEQKTVKSHLGQEAWNVITNLCRAAQNPRTYATEWRTNMQHLKYMVTDPKDVARTRIGKDILGIILCFVNYDRLSGGKEITSQNVGSISRAYNGNDRKLPSGIEYRDHYSQEVSRYFNTLTSQSQLIQRGTYNLSVLRG